MGMNRRAFFRRFALGVPAIAAAPALLAIAPKPVFEPNLKGLFAALENLKATRRRCYPHKLPDYDFYVGTQEQADRINAMFKKFYA